MPAGLQNGAEPRFYAVRPEGRLFRTSPAMIAHPTSCRRPQLPRIAACQAWVADVNDVGNCINMPRPQ